MKATLIINGKKSEVTLTDDLVKQIKESIPKEPTKRWRAEVGDEYYYVLSGGEVFVGLEDEVDYDNLRYKIGNYFKTNEEAIFHRDKMLWLQKFKDRIAELNDGWEPDWEDNNEPKYYFYYDNERYIIMIDEYWCYLKTNENYLFKNKEIGQQLLKEFNHEDIKKYYFGIKEGN